MKKMLSRVIVLMLMMTMVLGMTVYVAAETSGAQEGTGSSGTLTETPFTPSVPTYRVIVDDAQKDQLKPDRTAASAGTTVTIKVAANVSADAIHVFGKDGKAVELTKVNDTTYTFKMPACDVNVSGAVIDLRLNTTDHFAYIQGYPDGTFQPDGSLTRAEAATIFYRLLLDTSVTKSVTFSDVKAGSWYETAVKVLASKGVIAGYPDGSFKPDQAVTRAEFFKMVAMLYSDTLNTPITGGIFKDINGHWAEKYINLLQKLGIVKGDNGSARPNDNLKRCETAAIMNRILGRVVNNSSFSDAKVAAAMKPWPDCTSSHWAYAEIQEATNSHDYTWDINILTYSDHNGIFKAFIENLKNPVTERWTYIKK